MPNIIIAPSLLSSDFANLEDEVRRLEKGGADWIHYDVMDGQFVKTITFGPAVLKAIRDKTKLPIDAHLMVRNPTVYLVNEFCEAGADYLSVHYETCSYLDDTLKRIKDKNVKAGVAFNPETNADYVLGCISMYKTLIDYIVLMTVTPGEGGQRFNHHVLPKIRDVKDKHPELDIEVDGGIGYDGNNPTSWLTAEAGANILVAGSKVFDPRYKEENYKTPIENIRHLAESAQKVLAFK